MSARLDADEVVDEVRAASGVTVSVTMPLRHLCPFRDEVDAGEVTISWRTVCSTFELHSLREWLDGFDGWTISHEDLTHHIRASLAARVDSLSVVTRWSTAGGRVEVSA